MSIEAMKQALKALEFFEKAGLATVTTLDAITSIRQAIDAYTLSSKPPGLCMCGEPWRLESVHRKKSPCFDYIERKWVGLTDEDVTWLCNTARTHDQTWGMFVRAIEAKLKEKNT